MLNKNKSKPRNNNLKIIAANMGSLAEGLFKIILRYIFLLTNLILLLTKSLFRSSIVRVSSTKPIINKIMVIRSGKILFIKNKLEQTTMTIPITTIIEITLAIFFNLKSSWY
jgi:hypothetical protein